MLINLGKPYLALVVAVVALAVAGCGSSSNSQTSQKAPAASTPATPTSTSTSPAKISPSTPITSPAYRAAVIQAGVARAKGRLTQAEITKVIDCVIKKYQAEGAQTLGQVQAKNQGALFASQCAQELNIKPH